MSERASERVSDWAWCRGSEECGRVRQTLLSNPESVALSPLYSPHVSVNAPRSAYFDKKAKAKPTATPERRGSEESNKAWISAMEARGESSDRSSSPQPHYLSPTLAAATRVARRASFHRATMEPSSTEAAAEAEKLRKRQEEAPDKEGREPTPPEQRPKYMKPTAAAGARIEDRAESHRVAQERSEIRYRGSMEKAAAEKLVFQRRLAEKAAQAQDRGPTPQAQRPTFHQPTAATTARIEDRAEAHKLSAQKSAERYKGDMGAANEQKVRACAFKRATARSYLGFTSTYLPAPNPPPLSHAHDP